MRFKFVVGACLIVGSLGAVARAQSTNASVSGRVVDPSKAVVVDARIVAICSDTNVRRQTTTNDSGGYALTNLPPGRYRIEVEKTGFNKTIRPDVVLHVQDALTLDFEIVVGSVSESMTVAAGTPLLEASSATVSTLIDNRFVENMPLNGRTFSSLIGLTPGAVLVATSFYEQGQFSVNGQRPDANYFMVDGVSANLGSPPASFGAGGMGQLPATSAFGGLNNLVSLDALQEFRIQSSTFAPEFGRTPGAQVSVVTKSGSNALHGSAFEYVRNDALDANDWFANSKGLPKPELRQNDFGGVLGGAIRRDTLFFFGSYEGLRMRQPRVANTYVPSLPSRQSAPQAVQPLMNAFPLPNGADLGNGTAAFSAGYSDPSTLDSYAVRVDLPTRIANVFGRYSDAPSSLVQRGGGRFMTAYSNLLHTGARTQTLTFGASSPLSPHLINDLRFNYSVSRGRSFLTLDGFGGAVPPTDSVLVPAAQSLTHSFVGVFADFNPFGLKFDEGKIADNAQHQVNVVDTLSWLVGTHQLKTGIDYRRLRPEEGSLTYQLQYVFGSLANALANSVSSAFVASRTADVQMVLSNWSLFAQDTWNASRSLTVTYGLRWDYNSVPSSPNGTPPFTVDQVDNLATMSLAPPGTPLWRAGKNNFAPRVGAAWHARADTVVRAGAGIFYDLGYADISNAMIAFPYAQGSTISQTSFPLTAAAAVPPPFKTSPPASFLAVIDPNHSLPRTYEWNAAVERSLTHSDAVSITYAGAEGRELMRKDIYIGPNPNVVTGEFDVLRNGGRSSYESLQVQYRRRLSRRFQALVSYTWGHSVDDVSSDANYQNVPPGASASSDRGPSDYDIRNTFSAAVSYEIPAPANEALKEVFKNWSIDSIVYARSAPPVNVVTGNNPFGGVLSGASSVQRPDVVPGVPFYLDQPNAPGGRVINAKAFSVPASAQGNLGRNALRGFAATQWDMTVRRQFQMPGGFSLQARVDFFNVLNHPNFGSPINYLTSPQFGQATQMLNNSLGGGGQSGGLSPLYQIGGPRSMQLAVRLQF
jgi:hypothetical protein